MPHHRSGGGQLSHGTPGHLTDKRGRVLLAPDGGSIPDYPKGWRFLPVPHNSPEGEILKKNPQVEKAMRHLHALEQEPQTKQYQRNAVNQYQHGQNTERNMAIIADAHYDLVIAPQIKAEQERKAKLEEEQKLAIATLKIRVQELESIPEPIPEPIESSISYLPFALIGVVIIGFVLMRRT